MKILYFGNNRLGLDVLEYLKSRGEDIVGLVVHSEERRKYREEMIRVSGLPASRVFDGSCLRQTETVRAIRDLKPDLGISVLFGYLIQSEILESLPRGCLNLHPSYLPFNRGVYPNVWSIVEGTPSGVTLHFIDEGVDTGDIVAQRKIEVEPVDTGASLYGKLERASLELFRKAWPDVREGKVVRLPQSPNGGTSHRVKDAEGIDEIDLNRSYPAGKLIDIIRARTFPPYRGAYFRYQGKKVYLRIELNYEDE